MHSERQALCGHGVNTARRLQTVQEGRSLLGVRRCGEDEPLLIGKNLEPRGEIARMVRPWFELRRDAKIGAEKHRAKLGDQFLTRPLTFVLGIARQVAVESAGLGCPMDVMPISA